MILHTIECGNFKLDGGAMFGVVPKPLWERTNPADAQNRIEMAARSLLIEDGDRLILIDTGMGEKQSEKFFGYYALWGDFTLESSLKTKGFHPDDVTDVFFTHLHFDHCGGGIKKKENGNPIYLSDFPFLNRKSNFRMGFFIFCDCRFNLKSIYSPFSRISLNPFIKGPMNIPTVGVDIDSAKIRRAEMLRGPEDIHQHQKRALEILG